MCITKKIVIRREWGRLKVVRRDFCKKNLDISPIPI
jgi:hypothetical protein